jgi:hypothetical protein
MIPRGRKAMSFSQRCLLAAILALALGGCGDDDENPMKPSPDPSYPELSSPQNVLLALDLAYESRDSVMYRALYDSTYTGFSTDVNDPGSFISLTYDDEAAHIRSLATTPGISVSLDFGPSSTWTRLPSDDVSHPEWSMIQMSGNAYRIEITEGPTTHGVVGSTGTFLEFAFSPRADSSSQTDTLWQIVRWREVGQSGP